MSIDEVESRTGWAALFRDCFRQSRNAMVLLDDDRRHVEVNGAYVQLLGYRPSELIGRPVHEFRADRRAVSEQEWHTALRQKQFTGTIELLRADGGHVTVEFAGHPETVTGRQLVLFVALRAARGGRVRDDTQPIDRSPGPVRTRARGRKAARDGIQRAGGGRGAADRTQHGSDSHPERDDQDRCALARPARRQVSGRRSLLARPHVGSANALSTPWPRRGTIVGCLPAGAPQGYDSARRRRATLPARHPERSTPRWSTSTFPMRTDSRSPLASPNLIPSSRCC